MSKESYRKKRVFKAITCKRVTEREKGQRRRKICGEPQRAGGRRGK